LVQLYDQQFSQVIQLRLFCDFIKYTQTTQFLQHIVVFNIRFVGFLGRYSI
jgi:hypothetical protein